MPRPQFCPTHRESRCVQKPTMVQVGPATSKKVLFAETFHFSDFFRAEYRRTVLAGPMDHRAPSAALAFCKPWHRSNISTAPRRLARRPGVSLDRRSIPPSCPIVQCQQAISRAPHRKMVSKTRSPTIQLPELRNTAQCESQYLSQYMKMFSTIALLAPCSAVTQRLRTTRCSPTTLRGQV
jgi:hypothetical protein